MYECKKRDPQIKKPGKTSGKLKCVLKKLCAQLFSALGGEPSGFAVTPAEGISQIAELPSCELRDILPRGFNSRDVSSLKFMLEAGWFRGEALEVVAKFFEFLFPLVWHFVIGCCIRLLLNSNSIL